MIFREDGKIRDIIQRLSACGELKRQDFFLLMGDISPEEEQTLFQAARACSAERFGRKIYLRGLIEISNICKNNCYYCGIRRGNKEAERYRMSREEILACCCNGYRLGFRTFVLQGGEDPLQRWLPSGRGIPGARSPFRWAKSPGNPMRDSAGQGQTGICSAMRRRIPAITGSCIPRKCLWRTGCAACGI